MKNLKKTALIFAMLLCVTPSMSVAADSCEQQLKDKLIFDLSLDYTAFDQTMDSGWRTLTKDQCYSEASTLISAYIAKNSAEQRSLKWHLFQMEAFAGNSEKAIDLVSSVLIDAEKQKAQAFLWNDYVHGNAAFLSGDLEKLKYYRERLADKAEEHQGNKINLNILDNLIAGFGKPYGEAYNGK